MFAVALVAASFGLAGTAGAQSDGTNFVVNINDTNSPVTENDTLEVEVIVENTGSETGSQEIYLNTSGGTQRDVETVGLDPGASISRNLTWDTESDPPKQYEINVSSEDDFSNRTVRVKEVSEFDVEVDSVNEPIREGDTSRSRPSSRTRTAPRTPRK